MGNSQTASASKAEKVKGNHLTVTDSRTGKSYEIPITHNAVSAVHFQQINAPEDEEHAADQTHKGLRLFDPGFQNTAVSESAVTYVDGDKGKIQYRGYPIEDLIGKVQFVDTSFLLIWGHLPSSDERSKLRNDLSSVPLPHQSVFDVIRSFPHDAPPLTMITAGLAALQASQKEYIPAHVGKNLYLKNMTLVDEQIVKTMSNLVTISAIAYCHNNSREFTPPDPSLSYIENMLHMMGRVEPSTGKPNPHHVSCLERLWCLVADHEMTCSTAAFLQTASALPDPISCLLSAISACYGILHGGAIEVAYKNIAEVGGVENAQAKIDSVKAGKERLFGYGHRIYRVTDPRSVFIREVLAELGEEAKNNPLLKVAFEIDRIASEDEYFISRKLNPNADLFASFAYSAMGFPAEFILPLSLISRTQGFMAHWREAMSGTARIWRPQQLYTGDLNLKLED
ncbi:hypothetical protein B7494_g543 [Chlorociboria aeruginascens]|nr:hypothetical protein B7494_g543 [Chlorociboria aeruginascens]